MYLSIVIPAYNEEKRLEPTIRDIISTLNDQYQFEVIIVTDGSKDDTPGLVRGLIQEFPQIRLIENQTNRGKGFAVRQGMLEAKGEYHLFMDADNSTTIREWEKFIPHFHTSQIVIGSRDLDESIISVHQSKIKEILGDLGNLWIQLWAVWGVRDTQCGFKALTKEASQAIFSRAVMNRWAFDIEILALAKHLGYNIKEVPVTWTNDNRSHVRLQDYLQVLIDTVKIRIRLFTGYYRKPK